MQLFDIPVGIANELFRRGQIPARIGTEAGFRFLLTVVQAIDLRPLWPGIVKLARIRRPGQDLKLRQTLALMTHSGAHTVSASISATNDDNMLVGSRDVVPILMVGV